MSERNGDRARFQKNRKRKLRHRQRIQALMIKLHNPASARRCETAADDLHASSLTMNDEGGPARSGG